jgi:hypothetical protein
MLLPPPLLLLLLLLLLFSSLMPVRGKWIESGGVWRATLGINDDLWSFPLLADFCRFSLPVPASAGAA